MNCSKLHSAADGTFSRSSQLARRQLCFILRCKCAIGQQTFNIISFPFIAPRHFD